MKNTGIVRTVDELGRVVIPKEIRDNLKIEPKDTIEIYIDNEKIILQKPQTNCFFCNNSNNLTKYNNKQICKKCIYNIKKLN